MTDAAYDYRLECPALRNLAPGQAVHVTHWRGTEAVSRLYRLEVTVAVRKADLPLEQLLNQPATLLARKPDGALLRWHGIVTQGAQRGRDETYDYYQIVLEPRLARLRTLRWSDIYLNQQLDDIIRQLLRLAGLDEPYSSPGAPYDYRIAASQLATTRTPFTCQFEESCLDFLMRKLEYYGVYFWFEQGEQQESVVFANSVEQQPTDLDSVVYYPKGVIDPDATEVAVTRLNRLVSLRPGTVTLHDSNDWGNTALSLVSTASAPGPVVAFGEVHDMSSHFESLSDGDTIGGETLATWRSQELACERLRIEGEARTPGVCAGRLIEASEYLRGADPAQYYVIEVTHEGAQTLETAPETDAPAYLARFVALPRWLDSGASDQLPLQFRPARVTPVPVVTHMVNGFIDIDTPNQPKQYARPDEDGRYKVRLTFARQRYGGNQNSAWLRMATPYAGGSSASGLHNAGMHFPLREGTEVLITFLNGNPDRPVIIAALPNVEAPSVVTAANPGDHLIQTPSGNVIAMRDAARQTTQDGSQDSSGDYSVSDKSAILLSTTTQNTSLNLGATNDPSLADGFNLTTDDNGNIHAGTSMVIEVPGHMRMSAGSSGWAGLVSMQLPNMPTGVTIGSNAGLVVQNFMGVKMETVEAITLGNFLGGKISATEAIDFSVTMGGRIGVKWAGEKDINLATKKYLAPQFRSTYGVVNAIVNEWKGVAVQKEETAVNYSVSTIASHKVTTKGFYKVSAVTSTLAISTESISMATPVFSVGATGDATITGSSIEVTADMDLSLTGGANATISAIGVRMVSESDIYCNAPAITIGGGTVLVG